MAIFLFVLTAYTFLLRAVRLYDTPFYVFANPYILLLPFILIWLASIGLYRRPGDKLGLTGWLFIISFPLLVLPTYEKAGDFPLVYIRTLQYFWGPALLVPGLLGFIRFFGFSDTSVLTTQQYIKIFAVVSVSETLMELFLVKVLGVPPLTFPWLPNDPRPQDLDPFRPWGLASYPQPNGLILVFLFWFSYLYKVPGRFHRPVIVAAVLLSQAGTGIIGWIVLLPLATRRPFSLGAIVMVTALVLLIGLGSYDTDLAFGKLNVGYLLQLVNYVLNFVYRYHLHEFSSSELVFGTESPTMLTATGVTHDWAYIDVFVAYGVVGLVGYLLLYGGLIILACPREVGPSKRIYFAVAALLLNFHYGTLNYYVGQFLIAILAALQIQRRFAPSEVATANFTALPPPSDAARTI